MESCKKLVDVVIGTRPEAIKMAPVIEELARHGSEIDVRVLATGQHREMLDQVLDFFAISADVNLDIMTQGQSLADVTSRCLRRMASVLDDRPSNLMLVHGDTTTTLAASLGAFYQNIPIGHVEAGLRSFDLQNPFPEEANRKIVDGLCDLHFAPTKQARSNLLGEGIAEDTIWQTGNTAIDALRIAVALVESEDSTIDVQKQGGEVAKPYVLVTAHRRENFGVPIRNLCHAISEASRELGDLEFVYPVHPNPNIQKPVREILAENQRIRLIGPTDYGSFVRLMKNCEFILTDSGGIQEEGPSLGKPVLVLRNVTERPEAVDAGTAVLVGTEKDDIKSWIMRLALDTEARATMANAINPYGDGHASERIVCAVRNWLGLTDRKPDEF
jgi:UDP-N-acetylglucosamine 2-epimerase (non-hydrolysing)